jgi:hypothetical protein
MCVFLNENKAVATELAPVKVQGLYKMYKCRRFTDAMLTYVCMLVSRLNPIHASKVLTNYHSFATCSWMCRA